MLLAPGADLSTALISTYVYLLSNGECGSATFS
jgi:hypothetical protein